MLKKQRSGWSTATLSLSDNARLIVNRFATLAGQQAYQQHPVR